MYYTSFLLALILLLLVVSALLSGIETSLTSLNNSDVSRLKAKLKKGILGIKGSSYSKESIIATIIFGNTIVNMFSSSLSTALFIENFGNGALGLIFFTTFLTIFIIIISEMLPKTIALYHPEKFLTFCYSKIHYLIGFLHPITNCFQLIVNFALRLLKIKRTREDISFADSIRRLIALHKSNSNINEQEVEILNRVLDLTKVEVSQIMVHRGKVSTMDIDTPLEKMLKTVGNDYYDNVPLWQDKHDNIVYVLDAKKLHTDHRKKADISNLKCYLKKPWFVPENTALSAQLNNFHKKRKSFALVVDEYGTFQGVITAADIVREIMGDLEEDDHPDPDDIIQISPNDFSVNAEMLIRDINRKLKLDLPAEEASTLAGIVIKHARRIPSEGEVFQIEGITLKVECKTHKNITRINIHT